jgi:hypothetical protein
MIKSEQIPDEVVEAAIEEMDRLLEQGVFETRFLAPAAITAVLKAWPGALVSTIEETTVIGRPREGITLPLPQETSDDR